jgi:hypothetical protein
LCRLLRQQRVRPSTMKSASGLRCGSGCQPSCRMSNRIGSGGRVRPPVMDFTEPGVPIALGMIGR